MKQKTGYFLLLALFALSACGGKRGGSYEIVEPSTGCAFCDAVKGGNAEQIELALDVEANPNTVDIRGISVLMYAAQGGNVAIAKMLIRAGANINAKDGSGDTPLMWAISYGQPEMVKMLLACGANADLRNRQGVNAWQWAAQRHPAMLPIFRRHFSAIASGGVFNPCAN